MPAASAANTGISPAFPVSAEPLTLRHLLAVTRIVIDGVEPPLPNPDGTSSRAMELGQLWRPWLDEKLVEPKFDGACQFTAMPSNQPTPVRDYHMIALMRAADYVLGAEYRGVIEASVGTVIPVAPPTANG